MRRYGGGGGKQEEGKAEQVHNESGWVYLMRVIERLELTSSVELLRYCGGENVMKKQRKRRKILLQSMQLGRRQ